MVTRVCRGALRSGPRRTSAELPSQLREGRPSRSAGSRGLPRPERGTSGGEAPRPTGARPLAERSVLSGPTRSAALPAAKMGEPDGALPKASSLANGRDAVCLVFRRLGLLRDLRGLGPHVLEGAIQGLLQQRDVEVPEALRRPPVLAPVLCEHGVEARHRDAQPVSAILGLVRPDRASDKPYSGLVHGAVLLLFHRSSFLMRLSFALRGDLTSSRRSDRRGVLLAARGMREAFARASAAAGRGASRCRPSSFLASAKRDGTEERPRGERPRRASDGRLGSAGV